MNKEVFYINMDEFYQEKQNKRQTKQVTYGHIVDSIYIEFRNRKNETILCRDVHIDGKTVQESKGGVVIMVTGEGATSRVGHRGELRFQQRS